MTLSPEMIARAESQLIDFREYLQGELLELRYKEGAPVDAFVKKAEALHRLLKTVDDFWDRCELGPKPWATP